MQFQHEKQIWDEFPTLKAGVIVVDHVSTEAMVEIDVGRWQERARQRLQDCPEGEMPEIIAWRAIFTQMKATNYRCASESLLRRFRKENNIPKFHPLVDLCNALSLAYAIPIAVFDSSCIKDLINVRHASGAERYLAFNDEIESPAPGEIIFADAASVAHSRRWTFRQSKQSVVSTQTATALIVIEAHHPGAESDIRLLMDEAAEALSRHWSPPRLQAFLTNASPIAEFN